MNALNYAAYGVRMPSSDVGGAYIQGQQSRALEQRIGNQNKLAQATVANAQTAQQEAARKEIMQKLGMMAGALYGVKSPEEYQQAEDNLVNMGVLTREDAAKYNYGMLPQIVGSVRDYESRIQDDRDREEFNESVRQFNERISLDRGKMAAAQSRPADEYARYAAEETAAGRAPLSRIDYAQAKKGNGVTIGPDGTIQIGGAGSPKLNETESKSLIYFDRANAAEAILNQHQDQLTDLAQKGASGVPLVGNYLVSDEFQQAQQAGREFLASILRKDTGAAITQQEFDLYGPMFLPMPGDSAAALAQKQESRRVAIDAIQKTLGKASPLANERTGESKGASERKTINGVTYEKRNGKWGVLQ